MTRRRLTTLGKLKVVAKQARCPLCDGHLGNLDGLDFDHAVALALGGDDTVENLRATHRDCHRIKTSGRQGESDLSVSGRGDVSLIAKTKRLAKAQAELRARLLAKAPGQERVKRGKIPSRPFPTQKRKMGQ